MIDVRRAYGILKRFLSWIVDPLRADESITQFTLSVPEAQTTTVDSVQGLRNRPPLVVECPGCTGKIVQPHAYERFDCQHCFRDWPSGSLEEFELIAMVCPRCESDMQHGRRHPQVFDVPEWATCPNCQFHWDLTHWF